MADPANKHRSTVNKIFGETLPATAADERGELSPDDDAQHERWLRHNIPPHHS